MNFTRRIKFIAILSLFALHTGWSFSAHAVCSSPAGVAGEIEYDTTEDRYEYCDDTNWIAMDTKDVIPLSGSTWVPTDLTTDPILWFDATDSSSIAHTSGSVTTWTDKINSRVASIDSGAGNPAYSTTQFNGTLPGISFDGTDRMLGTLSAAATGDVTAFIVLDLTTPTSFGQTFGINAGGPAWNNEQSFWLGVYSSGGAQAWVHSVSSGMTTGIWSTTGDILFGGIRSSADERIGAFNGAITYTSSSRTMDMNSTSDDFYIGGDAGDNAYHVNGTIGEIIALDYEPSISDRQLIEGYLATKWNLVSKLPPTHPYRSNIGIADVPTNGLVAHWPMDETTGSTVEDVVGGEDGTYETNGVAAAINSVTGVIGTAMDFDDTQNDAIYTVDATPLEGLSDLTISFWIYPDSDDRKVWFYSDVNNNETLATFGYNVNGNMSARVYDTTSGNSTAETLKAPIGEWSHILMTYDGTTRLYVNGVHESTSGTTLTGATRTQSSGSTDISFSESSSGSPVDGAMDDFRIYDRVLSDAEIVALYNYGTGPLIGHWKLDETSGTAAIDSSGYENDGTMNSMTGAANTVTGKINTALDFDGTADYIEATGVFPSNPTEITVSAWIYAEGWGDLSEGMIASLYKPSVDYFQLRLLNDSGQESIRVFSRDTGTDGTANAANSSISLNTWHHIVTTKTNTAAPKIYIDGAEVSYASTTASTGVFDLISTELNIGRSDVNSGEREFDGIIDDVRIYDRALTAIEVMSLTTCTKPYAMGYDELSNNMIWCNSKNTAYHAAGTFGSGSGGCAATGALIAADEGSIQYDTANDKMVMCGGNTFIDIPN